MTKVLITGGGGMIGQTIARQLANEGLRGKTVTKVTLLDLFFPDGGAPHDVALQGGLDDAALMDQALADRPDVIFHLAAAVSGACEKIFDLGWSVNVTQFQAMLEQIRALHETDGYTPRLVFASSAAVYGGPLPDVVPDDFHLAPQSSYGAQKVVGEIMVADYARKGFLEGVSLRLPTIGVRPGKLNAAASSCFSGIIREPLNGQQAILPLPTSTVHMHASPRSAAGFFRHAAVMDLEPLQGVRGIVPPSYSCPIEEQIAALRAYAGSDAVALIKRQPDPQVSKIVEGWPKAFAADKARALGFTSETNYTEVLHAYVEDYLS